jgi:hypothetical protein
VKGPRILLALIGGAFAIFAVLAAIGSMIPVEPASPPATVDDVYAALSVALGGATPDFETQVRPVLDRKLTYAGLQDLVKSGRILSIATSTDTPAPGMSGAPVVTAPPPVQPVNPAPSLPHTVAMGAVLNIIRSQWVGQPNAICVAGGAPCTLYTQLTSITCDRTGDIAVPATVSCAYTDSTPTLTGTLSVVIDADNVVRWRGCATQGDIHFYQTCLQAAPTPRPVVAPPVNPPTAASCAGIGYINVSVTDHTGYPVQIWIDGRYIRSDIVNGWGVNVGSHSIQFIHADGSSTTQNGYVAECKSWTVRGS